MVRTDARQPISPAATFVIAAQAGLVASGLGLAASTVGGLVFGIAFTGIGGLIAGLVVGQYRGLLVILLTGGAPLVVIALGMPRPEGVDAWVIPVFMIVFAGIQAAITLVSAMIGIAVGRYNRIGPFRGAPTLFLLGLATAASVAGCLWFAATLSPTP